MEAQAEYTRIILIHRFSPLRLTRLHYQLPNDCYYLQDACFRLIHLPSQYHRPPPRLSLIRIIHFRLALPRLTTDMLHSDISTLLFFC